MSLCINPRCPNPQNPDNILFCEACNSELLLQGRYRAANILGSGGFGKTYEVKEGSTAKVLKVLMNNSSKAVELFQREAQVLSQLNNDGIPKVEANGYFIFYPKDDPQPLHCMVMEKIDGDNLWNYIKKRGRPIDGDLARRWLIELVEILQQVHERDILHRDIKPQNIILKPDGKLALIDFGAVTEEQGTELATQAAGGGSGTEAATNAGAGTSISSKGYTPFEQLHGQAVPQSDFFALGRTFVYLLTAKEPVDKSIYDAFNDELNWRQFAPSVSSDLADLIDKMMSRLPRDRPKNTQEILEVLSYSKKSYSQKLTGERKSMKSQLESSVQKPAAIHEIRLETTLRYAGFWRRFFAFIIDLIISFVISIFLGQAIISARFFTGGELTSLTATIIIPSLGFSIYHILSESVYGATLGKGLMNITISNLEGRKVSIFQLIIRLLLKLSLIMFYGLGIITTGIRICVSPRKQGVHDLLTGTVVVVKNSLKK
jgi:serine/threonine protein kinase